MISQVLLLVFDTFDVSMILSSKYHEAFDILQDKLIQVSAFIDNRYEKERELQNKETEIIDEDITVLNEIRNTMLTLSNLKKGIINNYDTTIEKINNHIEKSQSKVEELTKQISKETETVKTKEMLTKLSKITNSILNECTEADLKTTYTNLLGNTDRMEIKAMECLTILLNKCPFVRPEDVEKTLRNYSDLISKMKDFKGEHFSLNEANRIWNNMKSILLKIDPKKSKNEFFISKYAHILNFSKWSIAASEMAMNHCLLNKYKNSYEVVSKEIKKENQSFDFLKSILEFMESLPNLNIEQENSELSYCIGKTDEINQIILNQLEYKSKDGFDDLERLFYGDIIESLNEESLSILDLYFQYDKMKKNDQSCDKLPSQRDVVNKKIISARDCGWCGIMHCFLPYKPQKF